MRTGICVLSEAGAGSNDGESAEGSGDESGDGDALVLGDAGTPCLEDGAVQMTGHCCFVVGPDLGQAAAKAACANAGAHLVTVTSADEHAVLQGLAAVADSIGLEAPAPKDAASAFKWITGEPVTVTHWAPTEPSGTDRCVALVNGTTWWDRPCTDGYFAICERP